MPKYAAASTVMGDMQENFVGKDGDWDGNNIGTKIVCVGDISSNSDNLSATLPKLLCNHNGDTEWPMDRKFHNISHLVSHVTWLPPAFIDLYRGSITKMY